MNIFKLVIFIFIFSGCTNTSTKTDVSSGDSLKNIMVSKNNTVIPNGSVNTFKTYETFKKLWDESDTPKKIELLNIFKQQQDSIDYSRNVLFLVIEDYLLNSDTELNNSIEDFVMFDNYWKTETMSFMSSNLKKYLYWLSDDKIEIEKKIKLYKIQIIMRGNNYYNTTNFDHIYSIDFPTDKQTNGLNCSQLEDKISTYLKSNTDNFELEMFIITNKKNIRNNYLCISKYLIKEVANDKLSRMAYRKLYYISLELGITDANKFEEQSVYRTQIRKINRLSK